MFADSNARALLALGRELKKQRYKFVAVTPATHQRVYCRPQSSPTLASIFGWNRPFVADHLDASILRLLLDADAVDELEDGMLKCRVRFASIRDLLFVHSGFPAVEKQAVFFGPDTYRFIRALELSLRGWEPSGRLRAIDIGSGSGAGGIFAARMLSSTELILSDVNPQALAFSAVNAALNDCHCACPVLSNVLNGVEGDAELIISNPPYLLDPEKRLYRHGGGGLGLSLAVQIAEQGLARLVPGGRLVLYTGVPIIDGDDPLIENLVPLLQLNRCRFSYEEVDPDVFGEELERADYAAVDRIAVVVLTAMKE